jgi:hypothetical protein
MGLSKLLQMSEDLFLIYDSRNSYVLPERWKRMLVLKENTL